MKKILSVIFAFTLLNSVCYHTSANTNWTSVTSNDQIESGKIYMITVYTKPSMYFFNPTLFNGGTYQKEFLWKDKNSFVTDCPVSNYHKYLVVRIEKNGDYYTLFNIHSKKYIGKNDKALPNPIDEQTVVSDYTLYTIDIQNNKAEMVPKTLADYHLAANDNLDFFRHYSKNQTNYTPTLYKLSSYTLDESTDYIEEEDIYALQVYLNRTFTNDVFNSLVLPCTVNDYKTAFGANTKAYELSTYANENIHFKPVVGNTLTANNPYIITGTFNHKLPYTLGVMTLSKSTASTSAMTADGNCTYIGAYAKLDLAQQDKYILYNSKFYSCQSQTSPFNILPFRCYFNITDGATAKFSVYDDNVSGMKNVEIEHGDNSVYDIQGVQIPTLDKHHGVYIQNGHTYYRK